MQAEELMDSPEAISIRTISKRKFEATVDERQMRYQISIELSQDKVISHRCNCIRGMNGDLCHHVVASILIYRRQRQKEQEAAAKPKPSRKKVQHHLGKILAQVEPTDLLQFVKDHGRKDKVFRLLLVGRFVYMLNEVELEEYVESAFPILTKANEKVTPSKINLFIQVCQILDEQFKEYMSRDEYIDAYRLCHLLLKKMFYIKSKKHNDHKKFDDLHELLINNYIEIHNLVEAPEYKSYILSQIQSLLGTSYISAQTISERALWMILYHDVESRTCILDLVQHYERHHSHSGSTGDYFVRFLKLLLSDDTNAQQLIEDADLQCAYRVIQLCIEYKREDGVLHLMKQFYLYKRLNPRLTKLILMELPETYEESIHKRTVEYYLWHRDRYYIDWILGTNPGHDKMEDTKQLILQSKDTTLIIQYHLALSQTNQAVQVIKEDDSWSLITRFDEELCQLNPEVLVEVYNHHLCGYLEEHFGTKAVDYSQMVIQRAQKLVEAPLIITIKDFLDGQFPDRKVY